MREHVGAPLIFGGGDVVGRGRDRHHEAHHKDGDAGGDQTHYDNGDHLGGVQRPLGIGGFEQDIEQDQAAEGKANGDGEERPGDLGRAQDPDGVRGT